jgi:hypothetical protein
MRRILLATLFAMSRSTTDRGTASLRPQRQRPRRDYPRFVTVLPVILDRFRLDDKVAVITGGGRGLGAVIALAFADVGADVLIA